MTPRPGENRSVPDEALAEGPDGPVEGSGEEVLEPGETIDEQALESDGEDAAETEAVEGIRWSDWADGRPRRLKRGKHFRGDPKGVERAAKAAAEEMGRTAVVSRDSMGALYEYTWVQFVEGRAEPGQPCPVCGGTELLKYHKSFVRCASCRSRLEIVEPKVEPADAPPPKAERERSSELAEILATRLLSEDGEQVEEVAIDEGAAIAVTVRFHRAVPRALTRFALFVRKQKAFRVLSPPFEVDEPRTVTASVSIPPGLLAEREYEVTVGVLMSDEEELGMVVHRQALVFTVRDPRGDAAPRGTDGVVRVELPWELDGGREIEGAGERLNGRPADSSGHGGVAAKAQLAPSGGIRPIGGPRDAPPGEGP